MTFSCLHHVQLSMEHKEYSCHIHFFEIINILVVKRALNLTPSFYLSHFLSWIYVPARKKISTTAPVGTAERFWEAGLMPQLCSAL